MKRSKTCAAAFALVLVFAGAGSRAADRSLFVVPESFKGDAVSSGRRNTNGTPFKLMGGGQIDLASLTITFAGQATYLGQFTATGLLDPALGEIAGTMTAANGDTLNWTGLFQPGPDGEIEATLTLSGGTGRFEHLDGVISGPVDLDTEFMFTFDLEGTVLVFDLGL